MLKELSSRSVVRFPDPRMLVKLRTYNGQTGTVSHTFKPKTSTPSPMTCLALGPVYPTASGGQSEAQQLFAGSWDKCIYSWTISFDSSGCNIAVRDGPVFRGHTDFVKAILCAHIVKRNQKGLNVSFPSPEDMILISASSDGSIVIWDASTGAKVHTLKSHARGVETLAIDPIASDQNTIILFSADSSQEIRSWQVTKTEAKQIPVDENDRKRGVTGDEIKPLIAHETSIYALRFEQSSDSDGDLWTASADKTAKCLSRHHNFTADTSLSHPDFVRDVAIDEDSGFVITACRDEEVRVWEKGSGKLHHTFSGHFEEVTGLCIVSTEPKGRWVVSVSIDGTIRRWNLEPQELKKAKEQPQVATELKPPKESMLTEEEERELAELMDDDY
jgi:WD40 repeat protein